MGLQYRPYEVVKGTEEVRHWALSIRPKFPKFPKLNGTVKIPVKVFENLGIRFECTLFNGISRIIENFVFHSQEISVLVSRPSVSSHGH